MTKKLLTAVVIAGLAGAGALVLADPPGDKKAPPSPSATPPATAPGTPDAKPQAPAEPLKPINRVEKENGLIIEDLVIGTGDECPPKTAVVAHYRGTLKDGGTEFDSSYKRGQPAGFPLANVIKGWQEGVPGMKIGGKRRLTIPYQLAYGEQGRPPVIPPKADLVFEIEMVNFMKIEDIKVGDGAECTSPAQTVKVFYRGTLKEGGTEFDSNVGGDPIEFPLRNLIPGWQHGIPGMKAGGQRKLTIPWQFAYGERGMPPTIPPRADLVFEIELLGVK